MTTGLSVMAESRAIETDVLRVGDVIRIEFQPDNPNNCSYQVRGFVDDWYVVLRYWTRRHGGFWRYTVETIPIWLDIYGQHMKRMKRGTGPSYQLPGDIAP